MDEANSKGQAGAGTAYDNAFRTLQTDCPQLLIPLINEVFGKSYEGDEAVLVYANELYPEGISPPGAKIVSDGNIVVVSRSRKRGSFPFMVQSEEELKGLLSGADSDGFQIECESNPYDKTIWVRMFKYGSLIASHNTVMHGDVTDVYFPQSALVYLRSGKKTPGGHRMRFHTPGGTVEYAVPVLEVAGYTLEAIFEKKLFFLLPFYIFNREAGFGKYGDDEGFIQELKEEYIGIRQKLSEAEEAGLLTTFERIAVTNMIIEVAQKITDGHEAVKRGLEEVMGGQILEYEAKNILREGIGIGRAEGRTEGIGIGRAEGIGIGRTEGIDIGRTEGRTEGITEEKKKTARNLFRQNMDIAFIAGIVEEDAPTVREWLGLS